LLWQNTKIKLYNCWPRCKWVLTINTALNTHCYMLYQHSTRQLQLNCPACIHGVTVRNELSDIHNISLVMQTNNQELLSFGQNQKMSSIPNSQYNNQLLLKCALLSTIANGVSNDIQQTQKYASTSYLSHLFYMSLN